MRIAAARPRDLFARAERRLGASRTANLVRRVPGGESLSGPDLVREIRRMARLLSSAGVRRDSRVLVALSHPLMLILTLPAIWSLDAVPILADASSSRA